MSDSSVTSSKVSDQIEKINQEIYERNVELAIRNRTLSALQKMYEVANSSHGIEETAQRLAQTIVEEVHLKKIYIALVDQEKKVLRAVAGYPLEMTDAELKQKVGTTFLNIEIPLSEKKNICIQTMDEKKTLSTSSYYDILVPLVTPEIATEIQSHLNIKSCVTYPIVFGNDALGVLVVGMDKNMEDLSRAERETMNELTEVVGLTIKNAQLFSSLKLTTQKLQKANIRLTELDHVKDEFVSVASHELRTPMTAIKSYLWMILNKNMVPLDDKTRTYLFRAYDSTERLIRLVQDMLTVSRIEGKRIELRPSEFDLYELCNQIYDEIKIKASERNILITFDSKKELFKVNCDRDKIHEVILNLLGNAVKFTPVGGKISLSYSKEGENVQINVKDNGPGISEEDKSKLFQKFSRLEHSYMKMAETTGTGLGLYISKQIVSLHGGRIWVDSKVGEGSTFSFTIPLKPFPQITNGQ